MIKLLKEAETSSGTGSTAVVHLVLAVHYVMKLWRDQCPQAMTAPSQPAFRLRSGRIERFAGLARKYEAEWLPRVASAPLRAFFYSHEIHPSVNRQPDMGYRRVSANANKIEPHGRGRDNPASIAESDQAMLLFQDHDFRIPRPAHSVNRPGEARSRGIPDAARRLGGRRYRSVGASDNIGRIKGRVRSHINDKSLMLRVALPDNLRAHLHAESRIPFRPRKAGGRRCGLRGALDVDRAIFRARVGRCAERRRVRFLAGIGIFLLSMGTQALSKQNDGQHAHRASDNNSINRHNLPHDREKRITQLSTADQEAAAVLVNPGRPLPIDNVRQSPGILIKVQLQLSFFVDNQLCSWKQLACTLALVLIVDLQHSGGQIK